MISDRLFGTVVTLLALAFIASATQIQTSFLVDPVGPRTFPIMIGGVAALSGILVALRPDGDPEWPELRTLANLVVAVVILTGYAYALKPLGYVLPTAITASVLSFQISPRPSHAIAAGIGLSAGLFVLFKYALGLGLVALPAAFYS